MPEGALPVAIRERLTVGLLVGRPLTEAYDLLHCGVRDYTIRLAEALEDAGVAARVLAPATWGLRDGLAFARALRGKRFDVLHLQYPSIGHRHSLLPHLLGLTAGTQRFVVTLHEHSVLPQTQRAANHMFCLTADRLVFTTEHEAQAFGAPLRSPVIPIGSNIPIHSDAPVRDGRVLYFGQIRPQKGIEDVITLAALASAGADPARFVVIGSTMPRWREYAAALRAHSPPNVEWLADAPPEAVAAAMASATAAYLPFPDGAGLRRGSLLAALSNGLPVVAPFGTATTTALRSVLLQADTPQVALQQLGVLRASPPLAQQRSAAGRALAEGFRWPAIAEAHVALYYDLLASRTPSRGQNFGILARGPAGRPHGSTQEDPWL